ncbi:nucleotidyltransferase family protein [Phenylobacterium sp.]|uniref:nucleotidyltransferase family protein n=1 Tax=Phenylobacterium sp. TaxID=1871053 RepID=UPI002C3404A2|nr:nucleotidyltransferase family protein [Phenylobacterium sp.]HVI32882.1 nucleotidyltransferase family protein [Phenylobacterium sp.]
MRPFQALVLAGSRGGPDPLAEAAGVSHKALIRLEGRSLLERVVGALREAGAGRIAISANHADVCREAERLGVEVLEAAAGPSASVETGAAVLGTPLLVTTSDHALLRPEWIARFLDDAPADADICALLARRETVERDAPVTQRTYLRLADGHWSGCNLFYLASPRALAAVRLWRRVEAERKRPWRMAAILGPGILVGFLLGRLTLTRAVARLGRLAGVRAAAVATPYGLAAVDVDKIADLELVRSLVGEA